MTHEEVIETVRREFRRMKQLAERAIAQCSDEEFSTAPRSLDNSIAIIVKHVAGNLLSRWTDFLTADGEKPNRNRDAEFEQMPTDTRAAMMAAWERGWETLFTALAPLGDADLNRIVRIRGEELSVSQAVTRQLTHYSYHVGQIVYLAKHFRGESWKTLSVPRGESAKFNQKPSSYVR